MLKYFNANKKNSLVKLQNLLNERNLRQKDKSSKVKKILLDVRKNGDSAVIKYEKKFSKIISKTRKIKFTKDEINQISKKI